MMDTPKGGRIIYIDSIMYIYYIRVYSSRICRIGNTRRSIIHLLKRKFSILTWNLNYTSIFELELRRHFDDRPTNQPTHQPFLPFTEKTFAKYPSVRRRVPPNLRSQAVEDG